MLRVLFIRRQKTGGVATLTDAWSEALDDFGIEAVIDDTESWIPNETGWHVDRNVSKLVKRAAQGFDLVHAFGYRAAWACSEAFYVRQPWLFSAYDMPKTTHHQLMDRLNAARRGVCATRAIMEELAGADCLNLEVLNPGVRALPPAMDHLEAKRLIGLPHDAFVLFACGREDSGIGELAAALPEILESHPHVHLCLAVLGDHGMRSGDLMTVMGKQPSLHPWMSAADLVVVPGRKQGFSMTALEAMSLGRPVLMRRSGGLGEMAVDGVSAFYVDEGDSLAGAVVRIVDAPIARETVGNAGRIRVEERFSVAESARRLADLYKDLVER
jgi:glycosyltransferase involved in cell wall biosynthesis